MDPDYHKLLHNHSREGGPLTRHLLAKATEERVASIKREFKEAFEFITKFQRSVTVFGSTRVLEDNPYYQKARKLAKRIAELDYTIVTGGGPGIMEAANRGAFEAGRQSVGLNIKLPQKQPSNSFLTDQMDFHYFFTRKVALSFAAEAYIFFPGGYGTLDEFFEIITLVQTGKIRRVPIILVGVLYWSALGEFIRNKAFKEHRAISEEDMKLFTITDDEEEIIKIVKSTPVITHL